MKLYAETGSLIVANAITLAIALEQQWQLSLLVWPFWAQSVIIGGFAWRRILLTPDYSATRSGISINGRALLREEWPQARLGSFFLAHYGLFHLAYLVFLLMFFSNVGILSATWLAMSAVVPFLWSQYQEHRRQVAHDKAVVPTVGLLMGLPYLRMIPIHLSLFLGLAATGREAVGWAVGGFVAVKTVCEVLAIALSHALERSAVERERLRAARLKGYP